MICVENTTDNAWKSREICWYQVIIARYQIKYLKDN